LKQVLEKTLERNSLRTKKKNKDNPNLVNSKNGKKREKRRKELRSWLLRRKKTKKRKWPT
jgi:hypothetical protein